MQNGALEVFYLLFQGVLIFQTIYMAILFVIANRKDAAMYSFYLLLQAIYFFVNAPYTFFKINDDIVFDSKIYIYLNTPLVVVTNLAYVYFLKSFFSSIYKSRQLDKLALLITLISLCLIAASSISIYLFRSNQYIFYTVNLVSTLFSVYLLIDIKRKKIKNVKWITMGMVFNIIGNLATVTMIVLGQFGYQTTLTIGYPLLFMRCGILFDMAFYQVAIIQKWSQQEKELAVEKLESQLESERLRNKISGELHDDIGSTLSGVTMYSYMIYDLLKSGQYEKAKQSVNIIQRSADEMAHNLNDLVWTINPTQDSVRKLIEKLEDYSRDMAAIKNIDVKISLPEKYEDINLPVESRRNIFLFCKEAINNSIKYSNATLLELTVKELDGKLEFSVRDNGKGFDAEMVRRGNGLENMQKRADEIGAKLIIQSKENEGASVTLQCKIT